MIFTLFEVEQGDYYMKQANWSHHILIIELLGGVPGEAPD